MKCFSIEGEKNVEKFLKDFLKREGYSNYSIRRFGRIVEYRLGLFKKIRLIYYSSNRSIDVCCSGKLCNKLYSYVKLYSGVTSSKKSKRSSDLIDQVSKLVIERNILLSKVRDSRRDLIITSIVSIVFLTICIILRLSVSLTMFILLILVVPMLFIGSKSRHYLSQPELQYTPILYFSYRRKLAIIEEEIRRLMILIPDNRGEKEVLKQVLRKDFTE